MGLNQTVVSPVAAAGRLLHHLGPAGAAVPASGKALRETLDEASSGNVMVADSLLNSLNHALTEALGDVFTALWVAGERC